MLKCCFSFIIISLINLNLMAQVNNNIISVTAGLSVNTQFIGKNRSSFTPLPFLKLEKKILTRNKYSIAVNLRYIRKGIDLKLNILDSTSLQNYYGNLKFLRMNYIGLGVSIKRNIYRSKFSIGSSLNLNYLFSGKKYDYRYYHNLNKLERMDYNIFDISKDPLYASRFNKFENSITFELNYKIPIIKRTNINLLYERGLTSIVFFQKITNHSFQIAATHTF